MIAVCGLSMPWPDATWRATECRAVMCVKMPAAIISGIITMIMLAIVVPAAINAAEPCVTHDPSFAPKRLA